jgi:hypothetical protein
MVTKLLSSIDERYPLAEVDAGELKQVKAMGMTFSIRAFRSEGLGWVSLMTATGFFGLMKMDTLIINPKDVDMPLLSYDRIHAMGNDTLFYELYDTLVEKPDLSLLDEAKAHTDHLPVHKMGVHWYESIKLPQSFATKGKKSLTSAFDQEAWRYMQAYLDAAKTAPVCDDAAAKKEKAVYYVEGLLRDGGPCTDVFKKSIGEEKTAELFRKILFATKI